MAVDPAVKIALFDELPKQAHDVGASRPDNGTPYRNTVASMRQKMSSTIS